jgi:hypothetical protein
LHVGSYLQVATAFLNSHAVLSRFDVQHFRVVLNEIADFVEEAIDDLVHASDGLEECRLPFVFKRLVEAKAPEFGIEQFLQRELSSRQARFSNRDLATVACRAGVVKACRAVLAATETTHAVLITVLAFLLAALIARVVRAEISEVLQ